MGGRGAILQELTYKHINLIGYIDMKWILIIITFYQPHVEVKITEIEFDSPSECMDEMALYEMAWKNADENFHYRMSCTARKEE